MLLANFRLTGNAQSGHGLEAVWVNEFFVQGVTISEHGGDGIPCHFCVEDMRLNDSPITYNKSAGLRALGNHDIVVSACPFEENRDAVFFPDARGPDGLEISGVSIGGTPSGFISFGTGAPG